MSSLSGQKVSTLLLGKSGGQLPIAPEKKKQPKWKRHSVLDVSGDESKIRCSKAQYCIGTWNVRSMNQGKLDVVKKEMERVNIDILWISKLKWTEWTNLIQMTIISTTVQFSHSVVSNSLWPHGLQHTRPPCPAPTPGVYSNSCPLSQWCHLPISSSVIPFSSHLQSSPTSGSFQTNQLFASGGKVLEFQLQHEAFQ